MDDPHDVQRAQARELSRIHNENIIGSSDIQKSQAREFLRIHNDNLEAAIESLKSSKTISTDLTFRPIQTYKQAPISDKPVVVEVTDVTKIYKLGSQKVEALKGVSYKIHQGEFVALTGPSGSGKSTLLQLIGGLDKPSSGTVTIDGHNISKLSDRKLSEFRNKTVGFVFQFFYLQPFLKTQVNLEVPGMFARTPRAKRIETARELAEAVGLTDRLNHLPKELSGGQMQRAAIARALLNRPTLLLADEPTGNLDQENSNSIIELFEKVRQKYGTTVIIVTHDHNIAARTDREIKLSDGKVSE